MIIIIFSSIDDRQSTNFIGFLKVKILIIAFLSILFD